MSLFTVIVWDVYLWLSRCVCLCLRADGAGCARRTVRYVVERVYIYIKNKV